MMNPSVHEHDHDCMGLRSHCRPLRMAIERQVDNWDDLMDPAILEQKKLELVFVPFQA